MTDAPTARPKLLCGRCGSDHIIEDRSVTLDAEGEEVPADTSTLADIMADAERLNALAMLLDVREDLLSLARALRTVVPPTEVTARTVARAAGALAKIHMVFATPTTDAPTARPRLLCGQCGSDHIIEDRSVTLDAEGEEARSAAIALFHHLREYFLKTGSHQYHNNIPADTDTDEVPTPTPAAGKPSIENPCGMTSSVT
ncbi:MAG TPA: hypothetical protein VFX53_05135 [Pedococcus sp.]|nr:hypothetical protein [Pedococcus sp.]